MTQHKEQSMANQCMFNEKSMSIDGFQWYINEISTNKQRTTAGRSINFQWRIDESLMTNRWNVNGQTMQHQWAHTDFNEQHLSIKDKSMNDQWQLNGIPMNKTNQWHITEHSIQYDEALINKQWSPMTVNETQWHLTEQSMYSQWNTNEHISDNNDDNSVTRQWQINDHQW